jgi:hypothetical protein
MKTMMQLSKRAAALAMLCGGLAVVGCAKGPPPDLAPDPGLAARIQEIRIVTSGEACPGGRIQASYAAVLDDGSELPFSTRYDADNPPPLHVIMLARSSAEATPLQDGDWEAAADPLRTVENGFRLSAFLRVKPSASGWQVIRPVYHCLRHVFTFGGAAGRRGASGGNGPDLTARIGILPSPFYERLLVVGIEVGHAPPFYVLADADRVPPSDWLALTARGGPGGAGTSGSDGSDGADGEPGCPGSPGGAGGAGGNGGPGGPGGRGGRVTVIAPNQEPFLAGLVTAANPGGPGGGGGAGGEGGQGGKGGEAQPADARRCAAGAQGSRGADGTEGPNGRRGPAGPPMEALTVPLSDVFGPRVAAPIAELLQQSRAARRQRRRRPRGGDII